MPVRNDPNQPKEIEIPFQASTLESVDRALFTWLDETLNLFVTTNKGFKKVPVIWSGAERSFHVKNNKERRDLADRIVLPIIVVKRGSMTKNLSNKGTVWANLKGPQDEKGGVIQLARLIQQDKTRNFAQATSRRLEGDLNFPRPNKKVVYETVTIPIPVYIEMNYEIMLKTEYQQQMNQLVTPFITRPGGANYVILRDEGHTYEMFLDQDFTDGSNIDNLGEEEKTFETTVEARVLGHLIGDDKNEEKPKLVVRENIVEVKISRERVMTGEELERELGENLLT